MVTKRGQEMGPIYFELQVQGEKEVADLVQQWDKKGLWAVERFRTDWYTQVSYMMVIPRLRIPSPLMLFNLNNNFYANNAVFFRKKCSILTKHFFHEIQRIFM